MSASMAVADSVWKKIESTKSVTNEQLSILHFLFGKNLERATRIVDQRGVKRISGEPSGRSIFQVVGESRRKEEYSCFPEHYCGCYSFFYDIVNRGEQLCNQVMSGLLGASVFSNFEHGLLGEVRAYFSLLQLLGIVRCHSQCMELAL